MTIAKNISDILSEIRDAAKTSRFSPHLADGTPTQVNSVQLIAVSKTKSVDEILEAHGAGIRDFGENYVQEWASKYESLVSHPLRWHLIGPLQTNKVKLVAGKVHMIQSVDRLKLAQELSHHLSVTSQRSQKILVQIKLGEEESKHGILPNHLDTVIPQILCLPHLEVCGFMSIPPLFANVDAVRPLFAQLREIRDKFVKMATPNSPLNLLSMGMSNDFRVAIDEGANMVRIGSRIFGTRN